MYRLALIAIAGVAIAASAVQAASRSNGSPETITGTLSSSAVGVAPCTVDFADTCGSGDCTCLIYDGTASGHMGQGNATVYLSVDTFDPTSEPLGCFPTYANIQFASQTVYAVGAVCGSVASSGDGFNGGTLSAIGNYSVASGANSVGNLAGTVDIGNNALTLTLTP